MYTFRSTFSAARTKALAYNPTANILVGAHYDGTVSFFQNGKYIKSLTVDSKPLRTVCFVNNTLCAGSDSGSILVYDNDILIKEICAHKDFVRKIAYNKKADLLLSVGDDGFLKIYKNFEILKSITAHESFVMDVCFKNDTQDDEIAIVNDFGHSVDSLVIEELQKDSKDHFAEDNISEKFTNDDFSEKNSSKDQQFTSNEQTPKMPAKPDMSSKTKKLSENIKFLTCSMDHTVKEYSYPSLTSITIQTHTDGVNSACYLNDYILSCSDDLTTKIHDNYKCIHTLTGHEQNINFVKTHGNLFFTGSEDGFIKIYDAKTWKLKSNMHVGHRVWDVAFINSNLVVAHDSGISFYDYSIKNVIKIYNDRIYCTSDDKLLMYKNGAKKELIDLESPIEDVIVSKKYVGLQFKNEFNIYSTLGFRYKFKGTGDNLYFFNEKSFVCRTGNNLVLYDDFKEVSHFNCNDEILCAHFKSKKASRDEIEDEKTDCVIDYLESENPDFSFINVDNEYKIPANTKLIITKSPDHIKIFSSSQLIAKIPGSYKQAFVQGDIIYLASDKFLSSFVINFDILESLLDNDIDLMSFTEHIFEIMTVNITCDRIIPYKGLLFTHDLNSLKALLPISNRLYLDDVFNITNPIGIHDNKIYYTENSNIKNKQIGISKLLHQAVILANKNDDDNFLPLNYSTDFEKYTPSHNLENFASILNTEILLVNYYLNQYISFFIKIKNYNEALKYSKSTETKFAILLSQGNLKECLELNLNANQSKTLFLEFLKAQDFLNCVRLCIMNDDLENLYLVACITNDQTIFDFLMAHGSDNIKFLCAVKCGNYEVGKKAIEKSEFSNLYNMYHG